MLQKLLLVSILAATVALPALSARDRSPRRGLRRAVALTIAFNVFYLLALRFLYPHLF